MVELIERTRFFHSNPQGMFYVGFLKTSESWLPLCLLSDPQAKAHLDTLYVAPSLQEMKEILDAYSQRLTKVEHTFIQFLMTDEIQNLMDLYGLENVAFITSETGKGCGCGCGCRG